MDQVKECAFENAPEMKKAVWTLESIGHIRQRSGLIVAGESEDMDGHGHGHGHGQGRTGGKKMESALSG
jgi:hypothetical protein